MSFFHRFNG
ncbi:hypothetical protein D047_0758A, partial [Vibrio parahaemolyticus VPTS-2010_2]